MDDNSGFPDNVPDELRAKLKQELDTDRVATLREMCAPHPTLDEVSSLAPSHFIYSRFSLIHPEILGVGDSFRMEL